MARLQGNWLLFYMIVSDIIRKLNHDVKHVFLHEILQLKCNFKRNFAVDRSQLIQYIDEMSLYNLAQHGVVMII